MERINIGDAAAAAQPARARSSIGGTTRLLSAALLCVTALSAPDLAYARGGGGGGGFHGGGGFGGIHAGGLGGFHGAGIGGFHVGAVGGFHGGTIGGIHAGGLGGFHGAGAGGFHPSGIGGLHSESSGSGFHVISPGVGMDRSDAREFRGGSRSDSIVLRGGQRGARWSHGWHNGRYGWGWGYDPYLWSNDGGYDDYSGDGEADASQPWYYCSDPAGYYPYVAQCDTSWQTGRAQ